MQAPPRRLFWLTTEDGRRIALENPEKGWAVTSLDLGSPEVREVTNPIPDASGVDDRTRWFGSRVVTAEIVAWPGGTMALDDIARQFAAYIIPSRPVTLHMYLASDDTGPDRELERLVFMRGARYGSPMTHPSSRAIHLSWVAADPRVYSGVEYVAMARTGASVQPGRRYPLVFPRHYPPGGSFPESGEIRPRGEIPVSPLLRIYGPIAAPRVTFGITNPLDGSLQVARVPFLNTFRVDGGSYVEVDTKAKTAYVNGDTARPAMRFLAWPELVWPVLPPEPTFTVMSITGQSTSEFTYVTAVWRNAYLM
jgi:hypothetical protein